VLQCEHLLGQFCHNPVSTHFIQDWNPSQKEKQEKRRSATAHGASDPTGGVAVKPKRCDGTVSLGTESVAGCDEN
jgi:hypothetical protein